MRMTRATPVSCDYFVYSQIQDETAMYPKVWLDDGKLESIADKRSTALRFHEKIYLLCDMMRMKIFHEKRVKDLEFITKYVNHISNMFAKYSTMYSKTKVVNYLVHEKVIPDFILQHECHSVLSNVCHYTSVFEEFLMSTSHVRSLNEFIRVTTTTARFLENYIIKSETFNVSPKAAKK